MLQNSNHVLPTLLLALYNLMSGDLSSTSPPSSDTDGNIFKMGILKEQTNRVLTSCTLLCNR